MDVLSQRKLSTLKYHEYAEKTKLHRLFQYLLERMIVVRPENPISFLHQLLVKGFHDSYRVIVLGPPAIDRKLVCITLQQTLRLVHLTCENLLKYVDDQEVKSSLEPYTSYEEIPPALWIKIVQMRVQMPDCLKRGWMLEGFPRNRDQAFLMLKNGIFPSHVVVLEEAETEKDTFGLWRLGSPSSEYETNLYRVEKENLVDTFRKNHVRRFQIESDVNVLLQRVERFVREKEKIFMPFVPRVFLFGPRGSGRRTMASILSTRRDLVIVDFQEVLKQASLSDGQFKVELDKATISDGPVSDELLARVVAERLMRPDCVEKGWVMYDFPFNLNQAENLTRLLKGFQANRAVFLEVTLETCVQRLEPLRLHKESGRWYHLVNNPPPGKYEPEKFLEKPENSREAIQATFDAFQMNSVALQGYYSRKLDEDIVSFVDANGSVDDNFELLDSYVVGAVRRKFPEKEWYEYPSANTGMY